MTIIKTSEVITINSYISDIKELLYELSLENGDTYNLVKQLAAKQELKQGTKGAQQAYRKAESEWVKATREYLQAALEEEGIKHLQQQNAPAQR